METRAQRSEFVAAMRYVTGAKIVEQI